MQPANVVTPLLSALVQPLSAPFELPDDRVEIRSIIGRAKRDATGAMKPVLVGSVWSEGGEFKPVEDRVMLTIESEGLKTNSYTAFPLNIDQVEQIMEFLQGWKKLQGN